MLLSIQSVSVGWHDISRDHSWNANLFVNVHRQNNRHTQATARNLLAYHYCELEMLVTIYYIYICRLLHTHMLVTIYYTSYHRGEYSEWTTPGQRFYFTGESCVWAEEGRVKKRKVNFPSFNDDYLLLYHAIIRGHIFMLYSFLCNKAIVIQTLHDWYVPVTIIRYVRIDSGN